MQLVIGKKAQHELTADRKSAPYLGVRCYIASFSPEQNGNKIP